MDGAKLLIISVMIMKVLIYLLVSSSLHEYPVLEVAVDKVGVYKADALPVVVRVPKDLNEVGVPQPRQFGDLVVERLVGC